jgi:hypothetical protein
MDEIEKRLTETSAECLKCYKAWQADKKSSETRSNMMEAVHELRKVGARLEIELAISERDELAAKPIPIPSHRSGRGDDNNNNKGNASRKDDKGKPPGRGTRTKRPAAKSSGK